MTPADGAVPIGVVGAPRRAPWDIGRSRLVTIGSVNQLAGSITIEESHAILAALDT